MAKSQDKPKIKVQQLKMDYHFLLVGISSTEEDYKLCWHLNKLLQLDFERVEDLEILAGDKNLTFAVFEYEDQEIEVFYYLICNKHPLGLLVPEEAKADYILKISGEYEMVDRAELIKKIRNIQPVITAYALEPGRMKSVDNLLF